MGKDIPKWLEDLDDNDYTFMKKFILASGSLKELAKEYNIYYPTVRLKMDRLIQKIKTNDSEDSSYVRMIKSLAIDGKVSADAAKILINEYRKIEGEEKGYG